MTTLQIETEVVVPACAAAVYRVLAEYAGGRRTFVLEPRDRGTRTRVQAVLHLDARHAGGPLEHGLRALHAMELAHLPDAVEDRALRDSLRPQPLDAERSAAFLAEPAFGQVRRRPPLARATGAPPLT